MIHKPGLSSQRVFWKCFPGVMKIQANPCRNLKTIPGKKNMLRVQEAYRGMGLGGLKEQEGTETGD